mmetsp:Transcript_23113/g.69324  ORF Transcript_23113/g.69324 Transcript_23113/m.69324 type:complete len:221 (-) Transcript_23113:92-754(-)
MPPWLPNFRRMRSRASAWSRRCRATYSSVDSPLSAAEPLESPPEKPPAEKPPPGPSYADAGAAWRAGSSVGSGRPSTFAFRRSAYSVEAGSWYLALCSIFGSTPCFFQNAWRSALPPFVIIASCLWFHESMVTDRTNEMCTPRLRCAPLHSRHMSEPYVTDAHCGFLVGQSTHVSLPGRILISACICGVMETAIVWMERPIPFLEMVSFLWLFRLRRWRR